MRSFRPTPSQGRPIGLRYGRAVTAVSGTAQSTEEIPRVLRPKNARAQRSLRTPRGLRRPAEAPVAPRRAAVAEIDVERRGWIRNGVAGIAIAAVGLGVAGTVVLSGAATGQTADGASRAVAGALAGTQAGSGTTGSSLNPTRGLQRPLDGDDIDPKAAAAAQAEAAKAQQKGGISSTTSNSAGSAAAKREADLKADQARTEKRAAQLAGDANAVTSTGAGTDDSTAADTTRSAPAAASGKASLPITNGYTVAARFGQVGSWARYHTGFDFACPIGTPIHAAADGVVTNAGPNGSAGWAGNYVTIRHADGTQTLYAHMANTSVSVGQSVTGGQVIGHVGMTGRSFGPHVHFEVYPAGIHPGDVYKAVNPVPWLESHGLHP